MRGIEKSAIRKLFDAALPGSINLGLGEPDLPTPNVIRREAARVAIEEQNGYTTHAGLPRLRELIASEYPHLRLAPDEVIVTAGSQEALYLALMTLVEAGDEVLIPDPGFVAYETIVKMAGGTPVFYPMPADENFEFNADEFRRLVTPRTRVVLCTSPSNPTGRTLTPDDLREMAAALAGSNAYVISDEIYREIFYTPERPVSISEFYPQTLIVSGLSKSLSMTGWRLGWLCGTRDVISPALVLHGYVTTCAATVSQKAALARWTPEGDAACAEMRATFRGRRDHLLYLIENELGLRAVVPDGAFYTMVEITAYGTSLQVAERLLAKRVITVPGSAFGAEGEGFLRVSFCGDESVLTEGVRQMKEGLAGSSG
jgi:aspartate/methionine/tyrosine aminotransferase